MYCRVTQFRRRLRAPVFVALLALAAMAPLSGARAVDGTLGGTTSGSIQIEFFRSNLLRISGLDDINLGTWTGSGGLQGFEFACVYSSTFLYRVIATSANGQGTQFRARNAGGAFVPYTIAWRDSFFRQFTLQHNQVSPLLVAIAFAVDCNGGTNTRITAQISAAALGAAPSGVYSDTLTLLIQPN